jgi:hypothetical protein
VCVCVCVCVVCVRVTHLLPWSLPLGEWYQQRIQGHFLPLLA